MLSKGKIALIKSLRQKKVRETKHLFVAEGSKLTLEILDSDLKVRMIIASKQCLETVPRNLLSKAGEIIEADYRQIEAVSSLATPQKVLIVVNIPKIRIDYENVRSSLSIALDDMRDPGNLGTIIRTADWFGIENIFCSLTCADVYNPKAIQATMGSITRVKIHYVSLEQILGKCSNISNYDIYGSYTTGESIYEAEPAGSGMIVMGNESRGISGNLLQYITKLIAIPAKQRGGILPESLNVASSAAIICSHLVPR